jgi:hypothetical protein
MPQIYTRAIRQQCMFLVSQLLMWQGPNKMGSELQQYQNRQHLLMGVSS